MNQGRIWCVVNPTVGLPLFLGSVALMSFTVHFAVLNNSTWMKDFFNGTPLMKAASAETLVAPAADLARADTPALTIEVAKAPVVTADASTALVMKAKPKVPAADPS
jgi:light-harvesting protein B-800-850 alpha chain